ncbi:MAG: hypothetical protein IPP29_05765 [Bacteroidetes bacterium]|nr:hypothetical protein [Bacteroidota bacterium]
MHKRIEIEAIDIKAYPTDAAQMVALKAFMRAMKIKFTVKKEKPYNKKFVAKILESKAQYKKGNYTVIKTEDLWM